MLTSGEPNDVAMPRIAKHLPRFQAAAFAEWGKLLSDRTGALETTLNIPEHDGFGTVCSSLLELPRAGNATWQFASAAERFEYAPVNLWGR
jgi:hypothetical protein